MSDFFTKTQDIFIFIYGLVFFQLGMAIALQSRSHSSLDLARSLRWLSWFGIIHGLYEWGDIFIPVQAALLSMPLVRLLQIIHLITLGLSFTALFEFGVTLIRPFGRRTWWHSLPLGVFIAWLIIIFYILLPFIPDREIWLNSSRAAARYFIAFPGGLLSAYGLSKQTRLMIAPRTEPRFVRALGIGSGALVIYTFLAGLIPPPVPFFPGNLINTSTFTALVGVPPFILRSFIGLVLAVCIIRGLEIFSLEVEHLIEGMQQQQILAAERERIGRELHDGVIQKVYTAGLLVESAARLTPNDHPLAPRLQRATAALTDVIQDLRRSLGELRPVSNSTPLAMSLREIAEDPRFQSLVVIHLEINLPETTTLSSHRNDHLMAIVNGALSNTIRHAKARNVKINLSQDGNTLNLTIQDDGIGFPNQPVYGYGLRNMHDRARLLNGKIEFNNRLERGATVHLSVPMREES